MELTISKNKPTDIVLWNKLCEENGNLVQSTYYDKVQQFFRQKPIYFEVWNNHSLIGGVKFYYWKSTKLGWFSRTLSKRLSQHGELLLSIDYQSNKHQIINIVSLGLTKYLRRNKIVNYTCGNLYGDPNLLIKPEGIKPANKTEFLTGYVDIDKNDKEIFYDFNRNTRRNIKKAQAKNVKFELTTDIERFLQIEKAVYDKQAGISSPNFDYIRHIYSILDDNNILIGISTDGKTDLTGGFFYVCGDTAFSVFGGAKSNNIGAGHFFYFELMKYLSKQGIKKFYFGQIAKYYDEKNKKFTSGITNFKRGFRGVELDSSKAFYVLKPLQNRLWNILLKAYQFFNHTS